MDVAISAIGTAVPPHKRAQLETAELILKAVNLSPVERRLLKTIYKATGIHHRHSVLSDYVKQVGEFEFFPNDPHAVFPSTAARMKIYQEHAIILAKAAINNCLAQLESFDKSTITHLITVSCTGMYAPGLDIDIVHAFELSSSIKRTAIVFMGCYGVFNALKVADTICKADAKAKVLIVSVEICTIHFQKKMSLDNIFSNAIFSDGAGAMLIQSHPQQQKYLTLENFHCDLLPQASEAMTWQVGDYGFDIALSSYVPEIIEKSIQQFVARLLDLTAMKIDLFAIHPGGLKILQACETALTISPEQNRHSYAVLKNFGNMSSATILFVLQAMLADLTAEDHHKNIFSCAFGPGLTMESMMLKVCHPEPRSVRRIC